MRGNSISRREFLKGAVALVAAPTIISASALGAEGRPAPSNRIAMGAIGAGGMGNGDMRGLMAYPEVQMVAVCDVDRNMRESAQKGVNEYYAKVRRDTDYKGCEAYSDFRDLLERPDIDAVSIATPDHWHALISIAAAKAGKDIYCEKPLSLTIREARAMVNAVRRYGRVFQTGSQQRSEFRGLFRQACEYVRSGRIGKVVTVNVGCGGPSSDCYLPAQPTPEGMDWEMWLGPAPWRPYNEGLHPFTWRAYRDYSGGGMTDIGAHMFDIAQWGLNTDHTGPVEIIPPDGKDVKLLTYRYESGVLMYHGQSPGVTFRGTDGKVEVSRETLTATPESIAKEPLGPNDVHLPRNAGHKADFLECVKTRSKPICDVEIGCRSVIICHLGNIAYWLKRPLKWDPVNEVFVGDAEANRWLDRPKRAPWTLS